MDIKPEEFGHFLSEQRRNRNLTQQQLADRLHVTSSAVSKWERGLSLPDVTKFEDIAEALDLSLLEVMQCRIQKEEVKRNEIDQTIAESIRYSYGRGIRKTVIVLAAAAAVIMLVAGAAFGYIYALKPTRINYGTSEVFLGNEIEQAGAEIIRTVRRWDGIKLLSVSYAGDEASRKEAEYYISQSSIDKELTDFLVFEVEIFSPLSRGAWIGMFTYHWKWIMVQITPGQWETLTYGAG